MSNPIVTFEIERESALGTETGITLPPCSVVTLKAVKA